MRLPLTRSSVSPSSIAVVNKHAGQKPAGDSPCKVAPQLSHISRVVPVAMIRRPVPANLYGICGAKFPRAASLQPKSNPRNTRTNANRNAKGSARFREAFGVRHVFVSLWIEVGAFEKRCEDAPHSHST